MTAVYQNREEMATKLVDIYHPSLIETNTFNNWNILHYTATAKFSGVIDEALKQNPELINKQ